MISRDGVAQWIDVPEGRLKTRLFASEHLSSHPILVLILHGDIPNPPPDYQFLFAKAITVGFSAIAEMPARVRESLGPDLTSKDLVAAGILRPGYADSSGDRSSGKMGLAIADNYTSEVVDAVATVARTLKAKYSARAVVFIGHSGGAAIVANLLGRHPGLADGALLVACGCDPVAWRTREKLNHPDPVWDLANPSLLPLALAPQVSRDTTVRMIVGDRDDVAPPQYTQAYAAALEKRSVDVRVSIIPGLGHNILFTPEAFKELGALIEEFGGTLSSP